MDDRKNEENNNEASNISWWGSWPTWLQVAKEKSSTAYEFMKRDLTEFTHVVQTDAAAAVSSTAAMLKDKLTVDNAEAVAGKAKQSITSVLETITDVFAPQRELEDTELMIIKNSEPVVMDWWQRHLYMVRKDPKTFCHEPEGPPEMYENWLESFDPNDHQDEMTETMMTCSEIQALYDKLVPTSVSHLEFWRRYFYRIHLLRKTEAKRADLMRRAEQLSIDSLDWNESEEINTKDPLLSSIPKQLGDTKESQQNAISTTKQTFAEQKVKIQDSESDETIQSTSSTDLNLETVKSISSKTPERCTSVLKTVTNDQQNSISDISLTGTSVEKVDQILTTNITSNIETVDAQNEPSSSESTDGSRLSPVESLGKDYSTGDEWEKDFDVEINEDERDPQKQEISQHDLAKEEEDDWEKWQ